MDIKVANTLFDDGTAKQMYQSGFLPSKFFVYREIYLWVNAQIKARQISKTQAVLEAEIKFDKCEQTIWNALKSFQ